MGLGQGPKFLFIIVSQTREGMTVDSGTGLYGTQSETVKSESSLENTAKPQWEALPVTRK